jgi:V8-like Glu-specific endopeptidase
MAHPRSHVPVIVALVALISLFPSAGSAHRRGYSGTVVSDSTSNSAARRTRHFWTQHRMRAAKPAPLPEVSGSSLPVETDLGTGGVRSVQPQLAPARSAGPGSIEVPADPTSLDYTTAGRIFFQYTSGDLYSCSGTALNAANLSVVWTAGHCVHPGPEGGWARNWLFVPGYRQGQAPLGEWPMLEAFAPRGWTERAAFSHDFAAVVVAAAPDGSRLGAVTGGRGIKWNASRHQTFRAFGYPAAPPFDGETLRMCESAHRGDGPGSPPMVTVACDMTEGSSGGGWILPNGDLNSNVSAGSPDFPNILFGPYLGNAAAEVYTSASTSIKPGPLPDPASLMPPTPTPSASSSPSPIVLPEVEAALSDANDVNGALDVKHVTVAHHDGQFAAKINTHGAWRPSQLESGRAAFYLDLDTTATARAEYFVWILNNGRGLVARVERYMGDGSELIGYAAVTRPASNAVTVKIDASIMDIQKTPKWLASTKYRGRTTCMRPCWDFAPDRGFASL